MTTIIHKYKCYKNRRKPRIEMFFGNEHKHINWWYLRSRHYSSFRAKNKLFLLRPPLWLGSSYLPLFAAGSPRTHRGLARLGRTSFFSHTNLIINFFFSFYLFSFLVIFSFYFSFTFFMKMNKCWISQSFFENMNIF